MPQSAEEVTPAWLTVALRAGGTLDASSRVASVQTERIGVGSGYVAQLLRLRVAYDPPEAGPPSIVAKLPAAPEMQRSWWAGYVREWRFYRDLAGHVPLTTPRYLGGAVSEADRLAATLLEDLGDDAGAVRQEEGAALDLAEAVVDALARLHAAFWRQAPPSWLATNAEAAAESLASFTRVGASDLARYAAGDPPIPAGLLERAPRLHELVAAASLRLRSAPQTLVHGDVRPDNLLLPSADERDFVVIDWQGVAWNAGACDLAYFLGQSLEPALRREHERELLARYLGGLATGGVEDYGVDRLWDDYRLGLIVALFSPVGWAAELRAAEDLNHADGPLARPAGDIVGHGTPLLRVLAHRNWAAVEETRALDVL